jgi:hypothetical protein
VQEDEVLKSGTSTSTSTSASEGGAEVEKLKTELEAKKKEITNLKVRIPLLIGKVRGRTVC